MSARPLPFVATASLIAALPMAAAARTITFDPADGYFLGSSLVNNFPLDADDPDWVGAGQNFSITSLGPDEFGNPRGAAQSAATNQTNFSNIRFTPTAGFLGLPTTDTVGQLDFSFDLRNDQQASTDLDSDPANDFGVAHRVRLGGTDSAPIIQFQIFDNGRLQYNNGGTTVNTLNVNGVNLDLDDLGARFITIEGTIDFDAATYDLTVDGVTQGTGLNIMNNPAQFGQVTLQWGPSNSEPLYRQITLDNLTLEAAAAVTGLAGDFSGNNEVEQADLDLVLGNWGAATKPAGFVANTAGLTDAVDQDELDAVLGNWGSQSAPSFNAVSVPEPAGLGLLGVGLLATLKRARR